MWRVLTQFFLNLWCHQWKPKVVITTTKSSLVTPQVGAMTQMAVQLTSWHLYCPACRTTLVATRFRVAVICPIIQVPHCIRVFFYFVWFVFINHIFQFYYELCTYCNILDIYLSKNWILSIMFCFIWSYWIIYFLPCLEVSWRVVS